MSEHAGKFKPGDERTRELAIRAAQVSAEVRRAKRREGKGLEEGELPELTSIEAAQKWFAVAGRATGEGRLSASEGLTIVRAASEFVKAINTGELQRQLAELQQKTSELRRVK